MSRFPLTTIRECRVLAPMGWGLFSMLAGAILLLLLLFVYPFLAPTQLVNGEILVVEGWLPDYALEKAKERFQDGHYKFLIITGANLTIGHPLSKYYKSWANIAASTLSKKGIPSGKIILAPTITTPRKHRTYNTALAVKKKLHENDFYQTSIDVVSLGTHSRRTWLIFKKVFSLSNVGIIAIEPKDYDTARWWEYSAGVRDIISEGVAYLYAKLIFSTPLETDLKIL